ncbi:putative unusual protein kinase regulating ubiquinone biosynthesis (AarF/ABC1/UbiB family) [Vogesella perlucida]|nr:putative unusual protein kinase regulating ubiquinone biosynthesis (AarF/ABC1/UbiB family) [Vogesella perlucida]
MTDNAKSRPVPVGRLSRLTRLGSLAGGIAGGMVAEGARRLASGQRPQWQDLLLTPANAARFAHQLSQMRGAAMKMGQLLSMDAGDLVPPALRDILATLREDAHTMPLSQLAEVLEQEWGDDWQTRFKRFSFQPVAAASIGQVHRAELASGETLAIKVQYPGVARSIDSDVDNVASLLRLSGLLPPGFDLDTLLTEAKRQLHQEADYQQEAANLQHYRQLLAGHADLLLPQAVPELCTPRILAMDFIDSVPITTLQQAPQAERDRIATLLFDLLLREIFNFACLQSDPNFANYRYQPASGQLVLLDFGATRRLGADNVQHYRRLLLAAQAQDRQALGEAATALGYFPQQVSARHYDEVMAIFLLACEPLRHTGAYDFGSSTLAARMRDAGWAMRHERDAWHTPPVDALFLHRKVAGLYLLAARLQARVDIAALFARHAG